MSRLFGNLFASRGKEKALRAAARKPIGQCPRCQGPLDDHFYWDVASAEVGSPQAHKVNEFVRDGRWADAAHYQAANAQADIRVWRAIRCPIHGVALVPLLLAFERWKDDVAEPAAPLSSAAAESLLAYVGDRWKSL